jgi:hypothetical protein
VADSVPGGNWFSRLLRERSVRVAIALSIAASFAVVALSGAKSPLDRPRLGNVPAIAEAIGPLVVLAFVFVQITVTFFLTRRRIVPNMADRAPAASAARGEVIVLWIYAAIVMLAGRWIGQGLFGEGIGLHLWGYHAITPHVTGDTPMLVDAFGIGR